MGTMTDNTIKKLYEYGKRVYSGELTDKEAAQRVHEENPEVAESSAKHYINWYKKMREGSFLSWNTNANLLKYYVSRIIEEESVEISELAIKSARKYALYKNMTDLDQELLEIANQNKIKILDLEDEKIDESVWLPSIEEYNPDISKEKWIELLNNKEIFGDKYLMAMACIYDNGGEGSCSELEEKYHQNMTLWRTSCGVHLAEKIADYTLCSRLQEDGKTTFFVIPFLYRKANSDEKGSYIYKLRPELKEALGEFDILKYLPDIEKELTTKDMLAQIKEYIDSKGFSYDYELIENFYLCLKSKPFVLLAGTSGTGKTRLVRLFAEAIGALKNERYLQVAVKPDWSDSTDLFGHINLDNKFVPGSIIDFIKRAEDDTEKLPYILCLDEMNLARVEYYMSDFLSVMETRDWKDGKIITDKLVPKVCYSGDPLAEKMYDSLIIPENLYIVGTVNMDETTFPFSKKVLDRANTIEFSYVDFSLPELQEKRIVKTVDVENIFLRSKYLRLFTDCTDYWDKVTYYNNKIIAINTILKEGDVHFGYRMRDDIIFYMLYCDEAKLLEEDRAFDYQILQKILPRIQGSSESIAKILKKLFSEVCAGPYESKNGINDSYKMENYMSDGGTAKYKLSAEKIWKMLRRFEEDDFTSFWV